MTDAHFTLKTTGLRFTREWDADLQRYNWTSDDCRVIAWGEVVETAGGRVTKVYRATVDGTSIMSQHSLRDAMAAGGAAAQEVAT